MIFVVLNSKSLINVRNCDLSDPRTGSEFVRMLNFKKDPDQVSLEILCFPRISSSFTYLYCNALAMHP